MDNQELERLTDNYVKKIKAIVISDPLLFRHDEWLLECCDAREDFEALITQKRLANPLIENIGKIEGLPFLVGFEVFRKLLKDGPWKGQWMCGSATGENPMVRLYWYKHNITP